MSKELITVHREECAVPVIDKDGNVNYETATHKWCLQDNNGTRISNNYLYIQSMFDDEHYIVGDLVTSQFGMDYQFMFDEFDKRQVFVKYGIICLKKDEEGKVIPMAEKLVVPMIYNEIIRNNLNTAIAYANNGHVTYIDLEKKSRYYGQQLVPAVLDYAEKFSLQYEGFAECSLNGVIGYLPRNCKPRTQLEETDLLTEEQVQYLLSLHDTSLEQLAKLTGDAKTLKLTK